MIETRSKDGIVEQEYCKNGRRTPGSAWFFCRLMEGGADVLLLLRVFNNLQRAGIKLGTPLSATL
jgi:hypothetical protein